ncbi:hypothetical protein BV921_15310 [Pectobacterium odoriferum]|uniref:hypothetical protein n=1 Tax=Pectobacterium odoriferum TaxID=78398 RepID=UPI000CD0CB8F|nr:hypothetical protein [Pectobacterium odoriferum]POE08595.1 hypothetical protein BV921_15310 [Pectobacterium odoriferum]
MISQRTRHSLAQFLAIQDISVSIALLGKNNIDHQNLYSQQLLLNLIHTFQNMSDVVLLSILQEIIATKSNLRAAISPKTRFDERMHDLSQCLVLDGYIIHDQQLTQGDPSIADASPMEDDLMEALRQCGLPRWEDIIAKIRDSDQRFRSSPPDYNASLTNARIALETLAVDIAAEVAEGMEPTPTYNAAKWGEVLRFLRESAEITLEEEKGLAGVFSFLSPGAHRPVGIPENQMTRLGRSFALNMCWFLLQNRLTRR